ncbi:MAG: hypothetical protein LBM61_02020 [Prevotellaceae bacterium]|jgi:hypothetical protein|nr:hypothetical protein [Prevotellaceae bacterium]
MKSVYQYCLFILAGLCWLTACGGRTQRETRPADPSTTVMTPSTDSVRTDVQPVINVYLENSGSMDGYVNGVTDFERAVYDYLSLVRLATDSRMNLFYINDRIIPQGDALQDFIQQLEPASFRARGGNRGSSDISETLHTILQTFNDDQTVALFISDCIFSPGKGKDAHQYLVTQEINVRNHFATYIRHRPMSVVVYQLSSEFSGLYYNKSDNAMRFEGKRPFYIWLMGAPEYVRQLTRDIPNRIKGSGILHSFVVSSANEPVPYAIRVGSGTFELDKQNPRTTLKNLRLGTRGRDNNARFTVDADFSSLPVDENYIMDTAHYDWNLRDYTLTLQKSNISVSNFTNSLTFSAPRVSNGTLEVSLRMDFPTWIASATDSIGEAPQEDTTYGLEYLLRGVYDAFTHSDTASFAKLQITINP